ncbi:hypothetical protein GCM10027280_62790 [Micromonospora polyrhachis]|uniref:Transglutaminase-like putative cysteine protease n=1 Tax=Micromonospora polyrhachis TaxID=1282883 RepID=A0A7W7SUM7_9ACTN|nr:DUF3488 and transglutaminase-like domain-containing protein [Micromonospora polyrhachis]MBB4961273.1 transglutaminase-like putative cysteine protease [Micromonospora polyrhachis]
MRGSRRLGLVAGAATLLAAAPLSTIFRDWTWLLQCLIVVALLVAVGMLLRWWRTPLWAQPIGLLGTLLIALTWLFPSGREILVVLPTPDTFAYFGQLMSGSVQDIRSYGLKVPDTEPLLFITVLGVGLVAVVVDLLAVGMRRPALAGLPMLAIYAVPVAVYVDSVPPLPFVVGAAGFLWLLVAENVERVRRFGRRFTGDGRDVDIWEPSPLAAAGRRLAIAGVALAVLLPFVVPGMTGGLLDRQNSLGGGGQGRGSQGGPAGRVDLFASLSGQLNQSTTVDMVKVTTTESNPFYLRFGVADRLLPGGFAASNPSGRPVSRGLPDPRSGSRAGVTYQQHRADVETTAGFNMPLLPLYLDPLLMVELSSGWLYDTDQRIVFSRREQSKGRKYSFDYLRADYTPAVLEAVPTLPADHPMRQRYTETPKVREVEELVAQLTKDKRTDYARVRAIYDHFSQDNKFRYSLATEGGTSGQDIVDFLTNRVGFCQQYASAMAWLVRAAGIPARVAFGFSNGTRKEGNTYTLTNRNLHAWTEVYFDGVGWVPFDATPAASVPGSTRTTWAPNSDEPAPVTPTAGPNTAAGPGSSAGPGGVERPERDVDPGFDASGAPIDRPVTIWPWFVAAAVVLLLSLPALRRALLRRRRSPRVPTGSAALAAAGASATMHPVAEVGLVVDQARVEAHAAWDELIDTLVDLRLRVDPTETPRATVDRLIRDGHVAEPAAEATRLLGRAEERARYAREPLPSGQLIGPLHSVRRALAAETSRRTRMVATVLPPSVLMRWRRAITDTTTGFITWVGGVRSRLFNLDRLRRWRTGRLTGGQPTR